MSRRLKIFLAIIVLLGTIIVVYGQVNSQPGQDCTSEYVIGDGNDSIPCASWWGSGQFPKCYFAWNSEHRDLYIKIANWVEFTDALVMIDKDLRIRGASIDLNEDWSLKGKHEDGIIRFHYDENFAQLKYDYSQQGFSFSKRIITPDVYKTITLAQYNFLTARAPAATAYWETDSIYTISGNALDLAMLNTLDSLRNRITALEQKIKGLSKYNEKADSANSNSIY